MKQIKAIGKAIGVLTTKQQNPISYGKRLGNRQIIYFLDEENKTIYGKYTLESGKTYPIIKVELDNGNYAQYPLSYYPNSKVLLLGGRETIFLQNYEYVNKAKKKEALAKKTQNVKGIVIREVEDNYYLFEGKHFYFFVNENQYTGFCEMNTKTKRLRFLLDNMKKPKQFVLPSELEDFLDVKPQTIRRYKMLLCECKKKYCDCITSRIDTPIEPIRYTKTFRSMRTKYHIEEGLLNKTEKSDKHNNNIRVKGLVGAKNYNLFTKAIA